MKANFRICSHCGTRNRLDKESCVKCGESLEGVKAGDAQPGKTSPSRFFVRSEGDQNQSLLVPLVSLLFLLGLAVVAWRQFQGPDAVPPLPTPALTPPPTLAPVLASSTPLEPGFQEYTEGMRALRGGDLTRAVQLLRQAVAAVNKAEYRLGLAEALEKSGSSEAALAEYEAVVGLSAQNVRYLQEWAKALHRAGRDSEAMSAFEAALLIDPDNLAAARELADLYLKAKDFDKARPKFERIVSLQPNDLAAKQRLAEALDATRDFEGAAQQYRDILAVVPGAALTRALLSEVLMKQGKPQEALQLIEEGLQRDANAGVLYREKGRILDRQGRGPEAVAAYRDYIRLAPGATDLRTFAARIEQLTPPVAQ